MTTKSISIKCRIRRSGGDASKVIELTSRDLLRAVGPSANTRENAAERPKRAVTAAEKSAEGIVTRDRCQTVGGCGPTPYHSDEGPNKVEWRVARKNHERQAAEQTADAALHRTVEG